MAVGNQICLKNNTVQDLIYADSDFVVFLLQTHQYDDIIPQSNYPQQTIGIGYTFDGSIFTPPVLAQLDINTQVQIKIQNAIMGFNTLMVQFAASNVIQGITQLGKTQLIADALANVQRYGQSGSLYAAITALQAVVITPEMAPFLTPAIVANLIQQTQAILANL